MEGENYGICSSQESTSRKKKMKIHNGSGKLLQITSDRISDLPDSLLIHILSFLHTKDAFKTSMLSKRWKNIWTHVDKLHFNYGLEELSLEHQRTFISFVDHALLHSPRNLKSFLVHSGGTCFSDDSNFVHEAIHKWLHCIFKKNVECLELEMSFVAYLPPEWFYNNLSFVKLHLHAWEIKILGSTVNWPSLKILNMDFIIMDDEQMEKILLGCPVLETISMTWVTSITHMNIMSRSVKKLVMYQANESDDLLDLNAPWLQELEILGSSFIVFPRMINVSSLVSATLMLDQFMQQSDYDEDLLLDMAYELLESMLHVKELNLWNFFIQALSIKKHLVRPSPLFTCKRLTVHISLVEYELLGMAFLLQISPRLENLVIQMNSCSNCHFPKTFAELLDMDTALIPPSENSLRLKTVEILYPQTLCFVLMIQKFHQGNDETFPEIILAEYLFKNAPFMEKLVIATRLGNCIKCTKNCASRYLSQLSSSFFSLWVKRDDNSEWQVRKKCSTLEISRM